MFAEIAVGNTARRVRELTYKDLEVSAAMSGDVNPMHVDAAFAKSDVFLGIVAHASKSQRCAL
jgi:phosphate acetyltransferase/phosphate butyryltransferase